MGRSLWEKKRGINSFTLHILAMLFMLCDHLWATLFPAQEWLTCIGRLAFPIFAFMIAEGCYYTSNVKKYMQRLFFICCNFRNTIQLDYGKFCNLPVSSKRTVDISVRSVINTDY